MIIPAAFDGFFGLARQVRCQIPKVAARKLEDLYDALANAIDAIPPDEARNFFNAAGYEPE